MKNKPADMKIEGPLDQVLEQWGRSVAQYWAIQMAYLEKPYAERDQADFLRKLDQWKTSTPQYLKPLIDDMLPNTQEADVRIHVTKSRLRQTRIATALEIFRLEKGSYPAQLSELVPRHFSELPADVFSGQSYIYQPTADRRACLLYGVGPDQTDDKGAIYYDPTNGTLSAGDLLFQ